MFDHTSTQMARAPVTRPNVLLIHSDQHRFDCLGVNGHPLVQTLNLDRLAWGADLLDLFGNPESWPERPDILSAYHGNQFGLYSQRMVRDRRWKYVWNLTAEDELYDMAADPAEVTNRATDPECTAEIQRLRQRLLAWLNATQDPIAPWAGNVQLGEGLTT